MLSFFRGQWHGEGAFANGKKISANVSYELSLDSSWMIENHEDVPPNQYKSVSMWGTDASNNQFIAYVFDNSGNHRKFVSNGWQPGKLILSTKEYWKGQGNVFEHFIYEEKSWDSFKMSFEVSKDGEKWEMVDSLLFRKISQKKSNATH
jgi:hypothetical protein